MSKRRRKKPEASVVLAGLGVKYRHFFGDRYTFTGVINNGVTIARYKHPTAGWLFGVSVCSLKDQFCRRIGREAADARLFALLRTTVKVTGSDGEWPFDAAIAVPELFYPVEYIPAMSYAYRFIKQNASIAIFRSL